MINILFVFFILNALTFVYVFFQLEHKKKKLSSYKRDDNTVEGYDFFEIEILKDEIEGIKKNYRNFLFMTIAFFCFFMYYSFR